MLRGRDPIGQSLNDLRNLPPLLTRVEGALQHVGGVIGAAVTLPAATLDPEPGTKILLAVGAFGSLSDVWNGGDKLIYRNPARSAVYQAFDAGTSLVTSDPTIRTQVAQISPRECELLAPCLARYDDDFDLLPLTQGYGLFLTFDLVEEASESIVERTLAQGFLEGASGLVLPSRLIPAKSQIIGDRGLGGTPLEGLAKRFRRPDPLSRFHFQTPQRNGGLRRFGHSAHRLGEITPGLVRFPFKGGEMTQVKSGPSMRWI